MMKPLANGKFEALQEYLGSMEKKFFTKRDCKFSP